MSVVEIRFRVRGQEDVKRAMAETKKESESVITAIKQAGQQVGGHLVLSLRDARKVLIDLGGDTKRFEEALKQAGVSVRQAHLLSVQLNKEMNATQKAVLGITQETNRWVASLKDGKLLMDLVVGAVDKAKQGFEALKRLGKFKGLEESTADAMKLADQYDVLYRKLSLIDHAGDSEEKKKQTAAARLDIRKNISNAATRNNVSQDTLIEAVSIAQDTKSAGRELALENGGAKLSAYAKVGYSADMTPAELKDYIASQVIYAKNLKVTDAATISRMQGQMTMQEEQGSLPAKAVSTKGVSFTSQWAKLRKTEGEEAGLEGGGILQVIADAPSVNGDIDKAVVRANNVVNALTDRKTRERIQKAVGIDTFDKSGRMRPMVDIADAMVSAAEKGKIKLPKNEDDLDEAINDPKNTLKQQQYYDMFRNSRGREGMLAIVQGAAQLRKLQSVSASEGITKINARFDDRLSGPGGQMDAIQIRDAETHLSKLPEKFSYIRNATDLSSRATAEHPLLSSAIGPIGDAAGKIAGPTGKMAAELSLSAGLAGSAMAGKDPRRELEIKELAAQKEHTNKMAADLEKHKAELSALQGVAASRGVHVTVNVESGMKATVTSEAGSTKQAAASGRRTPFKKAGQN